MVNQFGLVIIQSLKRDEKQTGQILHDELIKYKKFQEPNLSSFFYDIKSKKEFIQVLKSILYKVKNKGLHPIVHIEMHGNEDGIQTNNMEIISWQTIIPLLREINILMRNYLVVSLGVCHGVNIISQINPLQRAPFRSIIGVINSINQIELMSSFEELYDNYFFSFKINETIKSINQKLKGVKFHHIFSEYCFDQICNSSLNEEALNSLINTLAVTQKEVNKKYQKVELSIIKEEVRQTIFSILEDTKGKKNYFVMNDLRIKNNFPEIPLN